MTDKYSSLAELKSRLKEGVDFRIRVFDRQSPLTIISPHGGYIEAGTSFLAEKIADGKYNLFDFQGLQVNQPAELHVTSTRFRDEQLSRLLERSDIALSVHSMGTKEEAVLWLGGRNLRLKGLVLDNLRLRGFAVNPDSPRYRGESRANITNLARLEGVQLELSDELLKQLFCGTGFPGPVSMPTRTELFDKFVQAIKISLEQFATNTAS